MNYYIRHIKEIGIQPKFEAYIQTTVLKKTLQSISFERRRSVKEEDEHEDIEVLITGFEDTTVRINLTIFEIEKNNVLTYLINFFMKNKILLIRSVQFN